MDSENQMFSQTYTQIAAMTMDSENQILSQTYTQIHAYTHTCAAKTNEKAVLRSRGTAKRTQTQIHTPILYSHMHRCRRNKRGSRAAGRILCLA